MPLFQSANVILMVQLHAMRMVIAFARRDSQAANVMNANPTSLVTTVINANQLISIIHCVKVCLSNCFLKSRSCFSISECVCNPNGSTTLECGKDNGVCSCKERFVGIKCNDCIPNVVGDKCDTCQPGFFGYPSCQEGLSKLIRYTNSLKKVKVILPFQSVNVILMVQQLWNVSMVIVPAKRESEA